MKNNNILNQVEIARRILWGLAQDLPPASSDWNQLVELVLALDEWRKHGARVGYMKLDQLNTSSRR